MQERDTPAKDDFVMSGKQEDREESYDYSNAEGGGAKRSMKPIVVAGVVLLSAIIVVLMFLSGSPRSAEKDQLRNMDARLKAAEEKLAKLEWIDTGLARLDRKEKEMATMSERMLQLEAAMNKKADQLVREAAKPAVAVKAPEPAPVSKSDVAAHKPEPAKTPAPAPAVKADAKTRTHVVQKGDTLFGISRKYGVPADQLMKQNKLGPKDAIKPGQQLVIPAKTS